MVHGEYWTCFPAAAILGSQVSVACLPSLIGEQPPARKKNMQPSGTAKTGDYAIVKQHLDKQQASKALSSCRLRNPPSVGLVAHKTIFQVLLQQPPTYALRDRPIVLCEIRCRFDPPGRPCIDLLEKMVDRFMHDMSTQGGMKEPPTVSAAIRPTSTAYVVRSWFGAVLEAEVAWRLKRLQRATETSHVSLNVEG